MVLRLSPKDAKVMVFALSLEHRLRRLKELAADSERDPPLNRQVISLLDELQYIIPGIQYVRKQCHSRRHPR